MTIAIASGAADVVGSGTVTTFGGQSLKLLAVLKEGRILVDLHFSTDPELEDVSIRTEATPDGMALYLVNFEGAEGRGSAVPVLLGELNDDLIFFHFRVFKFGNTVDWTVHYTFYRASKERVGWTPG
jgi:hypothetical protein